MIKNSVQLKRAEERFASIRQTLEEYNKKFSGIELELYTAPLIIEENSLLEQIAEYKKIKSLPFVEAINSVLDKPILLDNVSELLSKLRIAAKLSQAEMAEKLGWEQSNLSRFESENYSSQTVNKIVEYASSLGVWLHIRPSLLEEPIVSEEKIRNVKTNKILWSDMDSTSLLPSNDVIVDTMKSISDGIDTVSI